MKLRHYSDRTISSYARWVVRYIRFHGTRHPSRLGQAEVVQFLSTLAVRERVSASTQNQAMAAISFLFRSKGPGVSDAESERHRFRVARDPGAWGEGGQGSFDDAPAGR